MNNFFKNKNVLITGIDGFIGTHLEKKLSELGAHVFGISNTKSRQNVIKADIIDFKDINSLIASKKISICFHLAGIALVELGQEDPYTTFKVNVMGTLNILESARINHLERIIVASTAHVYGDNAVPYYERYYPRPTRPYETSKACTDLIAQSYADTFDLPVLIPRFVNIYGPGDINFTRLIPKTIQKVLNNESPLMWGGDALRDYIYIDDAIDGYLKLASTEIEKEQKNRIFNFGGGNKTTVKQIIEKIIDISGKNISISLTKDERSNEIKSQYVSFAKSKRLLKWEPTTSLEEGLKKTVAWYAKNQ